uniref:2'-phosphotransferase n=1 Tax=Tetraselmis sp. GSL018 TaxID=582737 RepID=A0A061RJ36_9CHLO|mmetsp:Transcript_13648/g.32333  ORF Transcript_13648/g.32333 Transcript_13648/m.32333 type:complete len:245 (-) Transcript_13648:177-911(-)
MGWRAKMNRKSEKKTDVVKLSKKLSYVLRHSAQACGLVVRPDGYVKLDDLLKIPSFSGVSLSSVRQVVESNDKQRFSILQEPGGALFIRANQGHTMACIDEELLLRLLSEPKDSPPIAFHGTYRRYVPQIMEGGLRSMGRTHVHLARDLPEAGNVISGMRASAEVVVCVDIHRAISDGLRVFESANGVILCREIPPRYFRSVIDRKTGEELLKHSTAEGTRESNEDVDRLHDGGAQGQARRPPC